MAGIEARRLVRSPVLLTGFGIAVLLLLPIAVLNDDPQHTDLMSWPIIPAFFVGCTALLATARQARSTESAAEAMSAVPGTESRRTLALAIACLVPCGLGVVWLAAMLVVVATGDLHPHEWWFPTAPDLHVWSALVAQVPVACLGGGLLGVLTGRWLRFPGSAVVVMVALVFLTMLQEVVADGASSELRLITPWAMFHSGTIEDGTQWLYEGNATFYLGYLLCLCAAAVVAAIWHDRAARTVQLRTVFGSVVVIGLACLALSMTTGIEETLISDPIPWKVAE